MGPSDRLDARESQRAFRILLTTLAEPGTVQRLPAELLPVDGMPAALLLPLALGDVGVTVHVGGDRFGWAIALADATGSSSVALEDAELVVLLEPDGDQIGRLRRGDALAPERGARLALAVGGLDPDGRGALSIGFRGPGVPVGGGARHRRLGVDGLDPAILEALAGANAAYPAGVDTWLFSADGDVAAIPRSASLTWEVC